MNSVAQRTWLQRNTKWLVLGAIALGLVLLFAFVAAIVFVVGAAMRSSDVYQTAVQHAQSSRQAAAAIGSPIEPGFFTGGSIRIENSGGDANLRIPVSGPLGGATLTVVATRRAGTWEYESITLKPDDHASTIDLLEEAAADLAR